MAELPPEKVFFLEKVKRESESLNKEDLQTMLLEVIRQSMVKEELFKQLLKKEL